MAYSVSERACTATLSAVKYLSAHSRADNTQLYFTNVVLPMIDYVRAYRSMLEGRALDTQIRALFDRGVPMLREFLYTGKGQEGAAAIAALHRDDDYLFPHPYRGFTHLIAKGVPLEKIVGEYLGRRTGMLRGFGDVGGFYWAPERGILGASTILGGNFSIVCGLALAVKKNGEDKVVTIFFGDGEASRATFGSALNLASLWKLPIVFICENNGLAISVPFQKMSATPRIADRGKGYGVHSVTFDGTSICELMEQSSSIIEAVRGTQTPMLIEVLTPRFDGHIYGEEKVRGRGHVPLTTVRSDPLLTMERELLERKILKAEEVYALHENVDLEVRQAVENALRDSAPSPEEFASFYHE